MAASLEGAIAQVNAELARERAELEEEKRALKRARTELDGEIEAMTKIGVSDEDILELNVAGEIITVKRGTLLVAPPQSVLHAMFSGRWDDSLSKDSAGRPYLEFSPLLFKKLVAHLRTLKLSHNQIGDEGAEVRCAVELYLLATAHMYSAHTYSLNWYPCRR